MTDIDRLRLAIDKWGQALIMEIQWLREAIVAQNISICESCSNNPCNKKAMLGDRRIYECTMYERIAEQTEPTTHDDYVETGNDYVGQTEPQTDCLTCRYNSDEWGSPKCDGCTKAHSNYEQMTDCSWK